MKYKIKESWIYLNIQKDITIKQLFDNNLNSCVANYYKLNNINSFIRPIHRLDKETCGCIIYSKCSLFQSYYDYQIENKLIKRSYLAVVKNHFKYDNQVIKIR